MAIGTSHGAFYLDQFKFESGVPEELDSEMEKAPEPLLGDTEMVKKPRIPNGGGTLEISDKPLITGGKYLGDHPPEGTPEHAEWNNTWSTIQNIGKQDPEAFMNGRSIDEEGTLLDWHKRPDRPVSPYMDDKYIIIRKRSKPNEGQEVPMSLNGMIHLASDKIESDTEAKPEQKAEQKGFLQRLSIWNALKGMHNPSINEDVQMLKDVWSSLKLPGDVKSGEIDPMSEEGIQKAFGLAGLVVGARMPRAKLAEPIPQEVLPPIDLGAVTPAGRQVSEAINSIRQRAAENPGNSAEFSAAIARLRQRAPETESEFFNRTRDMPDAEFNRELEVWQRNRPAPEFHPMSGVQASNEFHRIYNESGPQEAINFAHHYEETANPHAFDVYESHVSDPRHHPNSMAFDETQAALDRIAQELENPGSETSRRVQAVENQRRRSRTDYMREESRTPSYGEPGYQSPIDEWAMAQEGSKFSPKMEARIEKAKTGEKINFFGEEGEKNYGLHYFANEKGVGELKVNYRPTQKEIRVQSIGIIQDPATGNKIESLSYTSYKKGPETFGPTATKQILKYLKEQYPEAEWISGFRVSGARAKTRQGANEARMWIGKGPKPKEPKRLTIDEQLDRMRDELYGDDPDGLLGRPSGWDRAGG